MKKKEEEKKDKVSDMITKDSVKKDDDEKEEKPDTRGMYAKINLIKNKLRAAGQRDPMVMAVDACEENLLEKGMGPRARELARKRMQGEKAAETESTPAEGDDSFSQEYKDNAKKGIEASKKNQPKYNPYGKGATANPSNMSATTGS